MKTFFDAFQDPNEHPYLMQVLAHPTSIGAREAYLQVLQEPNDLRSQAISINLKLSQSLPPQQAKPLVDQLLHILLELCPDWWKAVRLGDPLFNCHQGDRDEPRIRFVYQCPMKWDWLSPTDEADVRICSQCREEVFRCHTVVQAQEKASAGQCVSLPSQVFQSHSQRLTGMMLGRPDPVAIWADQIFDPS